MIDFTLPELGENLTTGDVLRVLVSPGDTVVKGQAVLELETDKATIEVPSSVAGRIAAVNVKAGDTVKVGQAILAVEGEAAAAADPPAPQRDAPRTAEDIGPALGHDNVVNITRVGRPRVEQTLELPMAQPAPAAPSVRRLARELGVDVSQVPGSGPAGRISIDDVKAWAKRLITQPAPAGAATPMEPLPDFTRWGEIERQPMRAVRRKTAERVSAAWAAVPHVTQHDMADITVVEELRKRYAGEVETAGGNLTITAIAVKIAAEALKAFPKFNTSIDVAAGEIIYRKFINVGVAVDTDRGLLVPVIRDADAKSVMQLSVELTELSQKARTRRILLDEMQGGCFSISNLGGIGGSYFTPIVNLPEVAILGISRARRSEERRVGKECRL